MIRNNQNFKRINHFVTVSQYEHLWFGRYFEIYFFHCFNLLRNKSGEKWTLKICGHTRSEHRAILVPGITYSLLGIVSNVKNNFPEKPLPRLRLPQPVYHQQYQNKICYLCMRECASSGFELDARWWADGPSFPSRIGRPNYEAKEVPELVHDLGSYTGII